MGMIVIDFENTVKSHTVSTLLCDNNPLALSNYGCFKIIQKARMNNKIDWIIATGRQYEKRVDLILKPNIEGNHLNCSIYDNNEAEST